MKYFTNNKIFSEFILYSLAIGINRGSLLLLTPFLLLVFNTQDFGIYNYIQILLQFFGPIVGLNMFASIAREGAENYRMGVYLEKKTLSVLIFSTIVLATLTFFLQIELFLTFGILLGGLEALHNMQLSVLRTMDLNWKYFVFTVLKTFGVILIFLVLYYELNISNIYTFIQLQIIWYLLLGLFFQFFISKQETMPFPFKEALIFSIVLIPNSIAQWVITGVGRYFIKTLHGLESLGFFSKAFNLSMVIMLINSGIGLVLPQHLIKNYDKWMIPENRMRFFSLYSLISVSIYLLILIAIYFDDTFINIYNLDFKNFGYDFFLIYISLYFLGYYYYYSNILFVLRKNKILSIITIIVSIVAIFFNYFLILHFNIRGASVGMFLTYILYLSLCIGFAIKYEKNKDIFNFKDFFVILIGFLICYFATIIKYFFHE